MDRYIKTSNSVKVTTDSGVFERFVDGKMCVFKDNSGNEKVFSPKGDISVRQFIQEYRAFCKDCGVDYNKISQLLRDGE